MNGSELRQRNTPEVRQRVTTNNPQQIGRPNAGAGPDGQDLNRATSWTNGEGNYFFAGAALVVIVIRLAVSGLQSNNVADTLIAYCLLRLGIDLYRGPQNVATTGDQHTPVTRSALYSEKDGLKKQFDSLLPTDDEIQEIHDMITANKEILAAEDGLNKKGKKISLSDGRDFISMEGIASEWCALKKADGHFDLVKATTAMDLIQTGSLHPFRREPLQISDFIRGTELLDLLKS
jgi:hypothetical protein